MYKVLDITNTKSKTDVFSEFVTKEQTSDFIGKLIDEPMYGYFMIMVRGLEIASDNKESLKSLFTVNVAQSTIRASSPILLYRFKNKSEYDKWLNG